jgi:YHS domain-containing protein
LSILAEIVQHRRRGKIGGVEAELLDLPVLESVEALDPVCGMIVEVATARYITNHNGQTYYFCAKSCQHTFEAEPEKYASPVRSDN